MSQDLLVSFLTKLNALTGGVFLLCAFGLVGIRQMLSCLRIYVFQSLLLAISAGILAYYHASIHLLVVAALTIVTKVFIIPWVLRQAVGYESYAKREISQVINIPSSLLIAVIIAIFSYYVASPLLTAGAGVFEKINLPIGMASLLIGTYTVTVRGEAVPQLLGILAMENGAFFAGISIASSLPLIAELAFAFYVLITVLVIGLLAMRIHQRIAKTRVGEMMALREE
jgi:hydrogenase-4 membrane subunit HyfE